MREEQLGRFDELGLFCNLHNDDDSDDFGYDSADEAAIVKVRKDLEKRDDAALRRIHGRAQSLLPQVSNTTEKARPTSNNKRALSSSDDDERTKKVAKLEAFDDMDKLANTALKDLFKFDEFRLQQAQAVRRLLSGESAVVVFPTGGGKSLVFQIPALVFSDLDDLNGTRKDGEHGITLVVSPLISLMKDQCDALQKRGIMAASMDSSKSRRDYLETCDMLQAGKLKLLYCAPERLNNEGFIAQMQTVRGGIRLLAVDEAHCISEWGHAFRPDYLKIARFAKEINAERVVSLTATATERVSKDICKAFEIPEAGLFKTTTYRPNLHLQAVSGMTKAELYPQLYSFLNEHKGSTIVYVTLQKDAEQLAARLSSKGFHALAFHAGLITDAKTNRQDQFMRSSNTFGMGIDKATIRNVVHFCVPSSLESYSQEIGRAGRDGKVSQCMMYLCGEDVHLREMFARGDVPTKHAIRDVLADIFSTKKGKLRFGETIQVNPAAQEKSYDIRSATLGNIYAQLELSHGLIRAGTPIYTTYQWTSGEKIGMMATDESPAAAAIRTHAQKKMKWTTFNPDEASKLVSRQDLICKLTQWQEARVFGEFKASGAEKVFKITGSVPSTKDEFESLATALYSLILAREKEALQRTDEMLHLVTGSECFSLALARHFGDRLPNNKESCETCTWCKTQKPVTLQLPPPIEFNRVAFEAVLAKVPKRNDPRLLARIAFGITSPACTALKLTKDAVFGSMNDHPFEDLLREFTQECDKRKK